MNKIQFEFEAEKLPELIQKALQNRYKENVEIKSAGNPFQVRLYITYPNLHNDYTIQVYNVDDNPTAFNGLYIIKVVFSKVNRSNDSEELTLDFGPGTQENKWRQIFLGSPKSKTFKFEIEKTSEELALFLCNALNDFFRANYY